MLPVNYLLVPFLLIPLYYVSCELKSGRNYAELDRKQVHAFTAGNNSVLDDSGGTDKACSSVCLHNENMSATGASTISESADSSDGKYQILANLGAFNPRFMAQTFEEAVRMLDLDQSSELSTAIQEVNDRLHIATTNSSSYAVLHEQPEKYKREKRRQKEFASSSRCILTLILEQCQEAGEEVEPGYISACETCRGVYMASNNCFPKYVNAIACGKSEIGCAFDIENHPLGKCSTTHLQLYFMQSEEGKYGESSLTEMLTVPSGCQCALNKHSTFLSGVRGGGWRPRHRGGRPGHGGVVPSSLPGGHFGGRPGSRTRIYVFGRFDNGLGHEKGQGLPRVLYTTPLENDVTALSAKASNTWQRDSLTSAAPDRKQLPPPISATVDERQRYPSKNATSNKVKGYPSTDAKVGKMQRHPSSKAGANRKQPQPSKNAAFDGMQRSLPSSTTVGGKQRYPSKNPVTNGMQLYPSNSVTVDRMQPIPATAVNGRQLYLPTTAVDSIQPYPSPNVAVHGMQYPLPTSAAVVGVQHYPSAAPIANRIQLYPSINAAFNGMQPYLFTSAAVNAIPGLPALPPPGLYQVA